MKNNKELQKVLQNRHKYTIFKTKWGWFGMVATDKGLYRTHLPAQNHQKVKQRLLKNLPEPQYAKQLFNTLQQQIKAYYKGNYVDFNTDIPIDLHSFSAFTQIILTAARRIKFGQKLTYGQLAAQGDRPKAARAVGLIMAKNPLPLIIPCHRVIRSNGSLGGFSATGGIKTKQNMLNLEAQIKK
ncbi:MAG: methylated-DNA--[protein]-cysteine S-methyltransferase [Planctomycetota bacterium]|jgi:methylated-DNA-[protein]-cysteine S-methyltransferase